MVIYRIGRCDKMDRIFNLSQLHKNASSEDLKQGSFGIEWEG